MHTIFSVLALTSLINSVSARITEHEVSLIFPAGDVRQNQTITFGMGQPQWQDGLVRNFNVSLLAPNGTTVSSLSGGTNVTNENCSAAGDRASSISRAVEVVGTCVFILPVSAKVVSHSYSILLGGPLSGIPPIHSPRTPPRPILPSVDRLLSPSRPHCSIRRSAYVAISQPMFLPPQ